MSLPGTYTHWYTPEKIGKSENIRNDFSVMTNVSDLPELWGFLDRYVNAQRLSNMSHSFSPLTEREAPASG